MKHGFGTLYYVDGKKYIGQFQKDKQHGKGKVTFPNGTDKEYTYHEGKKITLN